MIKVEIAFGKATQQWLLCIEIAEGSTILQAITQSGILHECPEINLEKQKVGVFGKIYPLTEQVKDGDRIEIYRPLLIDPKELRRIRALYNKTNYD